MGDSRFKGIPSNQINSIQGKNAERADKPGFVVDDHFSRPAITRRLKQPTRTVYETDSLAPPCGFPHDDLRPAWSCFRRGLPSRTGHPIRWCALTAPFHPYLVKASSRQAPRGTLTFGGLLSVALSRSLRTVGITHHRVL